MRQLKMTVEEFNPDERKFRKNPDATESVSSLDNSNYLSELNNEREKLKELYNKYFNDTFYMLETCLSVKAQHLIDGITLPMFLLLLGLPGGYKTTVLDTINWLDGCLYLDRFTPRSLQSHMATLTEEQLRENDLLPKIKNKTLITPDLTPILSTDSDNLREVIGILIRILDGRGLQSASGAHGIREYKGFYYFTWIGAVARIHPNVWKMLSSMGPKIYCLFIRSEPLTEEEREQKMMATQKGDYLIKLEEVQKQTKTVWDLLKKFPLQSHNKIVWDKSRDDTDAIKKIAILAQALACLRAFVPTNDTAGTGGTNYGFGEPIPEDPNRPFQILYNLARGHAVFYGRNFVTNDDLEVVVCVALSSAPRDRLDKLFSLIENNGKFNTNQFIKETDTVRATALRNMELLTVLGLAERAKEPGTTKPLNVLKLKDYYNWFLTDEFKKYLKNIRTKSHTFIF